MKKVLPLLIALIFVLPITNAFAFENTTSETKKITMELNTPMTIYMVGLSTSKSESLSVKFYNADKILLKSNNATSPVNQGTVSTFFNVMQEKVKYIEFTVGPGFKLLKFDIKENAETAYVPGTNNTTYETPPDFYPVPFVGLPVTDLAFEQTFNSIDLTWVNPVSLGIGSIIVKSNGIEVATLANTAEVYSFTDLNSETIYNLEVIVKYTDGSLSPGEKITVTTDSKPIDIKPPAEISGLVFSESSNDVNFSWVNPIDNDFSHIKIFRDGVLIKNNHLSNKYFDINLVPNTTYVYKFVTVDATGNSSSGYIQTFVTPVEADKLPPVAPIGVTVTVGNQAGQLVWEKNKEVDIKGYNVYVNGVKSNSALLLSNKYVLTNLDNDTTYSISVTAVDTSGNESLMSSAELLKPSKDSMPVLKMKYDLKDVATSSGNWFSSIWIIVAFSVAIPLAFLVSRRVKTLFLG